MKKVITLALFAFPAFSMAFVSMPDDSIGKTKVNGKLHVLHRVEKGEGLLAICRKYNVKKEDVLKANEGMTESLNLGQVILIPYSTLRPEEVKPQKATVNETHAEADAKETTPTDNRNGKNTHTVMAGETMYRIAKMYNISEADLRTWNNLSDNSLKEGLILFIKQPAKTSAPVPVVKKDSVKTPSPKANEPHPMASSTGVKEREESGVARWFADDALSGGKLLALHKTAPIGTIIKLTNHLNNKSVFVRVVGVLPDTDENKNIIIKISRSTAERIGMRDEQTHVKLNYSVE
jgi:LysM repeat protein